MHLFPVIILSNIIFDYSNNLLSCSVDKITKSTYNLVLVILTVGVVGLLILTTSVWTLTFLCSLFVITQFADQVKVKDTS